MFDEDYFNSLLNSISTNKSTTTTENNESSTDYSPQTSYDNDTDSSYNTGYDYSVTPNYTEQQSYDSVSNNFLNEASEQKVISQMETPMINKTEAPVNLVKSRSKIRLETRMKVVLNVFAIIVACLAFITIFNFAEVKRLENGFSEKQAEISMLQKSITEANVSYTLISDDEYIKNWAEQEGFVEASESNTITVELEEMHTEPESPKVSSNWFNDVCDFFSKLFA